MTTDISYMEQLAFDGLLYYRIADDTPSHPRGTAIFPDAVDREGHIFTVWGFPRIKRIYLLERGIRRFFKQDSFYVEEKLDGYNVRLVRVRGHILALTRGGFVCPYTTEWAEVWAESMGLHEFFNDYPDHVLCGEALGASPYNAQNLYELPPGLHFFLFEVMNQEGQLLPTAEKYSLALRYALPTVPQFGAFTLDRLDELRQLLMEINERRGEGVVLKSPAADKAVKYVTPKADLEDIRDNWIFLFDLNSGYFTNRLLRTALFIQEFGLDEEEYAYRIGKSVLQGLASLRDYHHSAEEFTILVRNVQTWNSLRQLLSRRVRIEERYAHPVILEGRPFIQIGFKRIWRKSSRRFKNILRGYGHYD